MKRLFTTFALATIMTVGATFANAGIIVGDSPSTTTCTAQTKDGIIVFGASATDGIIVFGVADGIIVFGKDGIIVFGKDDTPAPCVARDGIIVGD